MFDVYIIYSKSINKYYVGETVDISKRLFEHNTGLYQNAFTSKTNDWELVLKIDCKNRVIARKIEQHIKHMKSRKYIKNLTIYPEMVEKLKSKFT